MKISSLKVLIKGMKSIKETAKLKMVPLSKTLVKSCESKGGGYTMAAMIFMMFYSTE